MSCIRLTDAEYAEHLQNRPECPLWQSLEWKRYQEALGRETRLYGLKMRNQESGIRNQECAATALVIVDRTAFGLSTWDIPRGPIGTSPPASPAGGGLCGPGEAIPALLTGIGEEARRGGCMTLYASPTVVLPPCSQRSMVHYQLSARHEQPEATIVLDLTLSDGDLLAQMKPKGRYNIRLAQRRGVRVGESRDIDAFYALLKKTARRDGFAIRPGEHYGKFLEKLSGGFLLLARAPRQPSRFALRPASRDAHTHSTEHPIAALLGVTHGKTGYYYYGASDDAHRSLMAPYALQWEAMKLCRGRGCTEYDLLGIGSHWKGVTRFKEQFGGRVVRSPPEQEIVLRPVARTLIGWKRNVWNRWHGPLARAPHASPKE